MSCGKFDLLGTSLGLFLIAVNFPSFLRTCSISSTRIVSLTPRSHVVDPLTQVHPRDILALSSGEYIRTDFWAPNPRVTIPRSTRYSSGRLSSSSRRPEGMHV